MQNGGEQKRESVYGVGEGEEIPPKSR